MASLAMRMIKTRRKSTLILVAGCVIIILAICVFNNVMTSYCPTYIVASQKSQILTRGKSAQPISKRMKAVNEPPPPLPLPLPIKSKQPTNDSSQQRQSQTQHEKHSSISTVSARYSANKITNNNDILNNVSFSDLMHVIEINSLNDTQFKKWTKKHMYKRHKNAFEEPRWVINGDTLCGNDTEMIIVMPAVASHVLMRVLIRQTWASSLYGMNYPQIRPNSLRTKLAFLYGTRGLSDDMKKVLKIEASRHQDVVAADFVDSYRNLSLKMMVGLNWANTFCKSAKYFVKADLDTFVNIPLLSRFLLEISEKVPRYILGHRHTWPKHPVLRSGKWKVEDDDYPFKSFPPYLLGHSYVISGKLVPLLVLAGKHLPLIPTEDSLITGVLARVIHAPRLHYEGFASVFKKTISCKIVHNYEVTVTKMSFARLVLMWRDILANECSEKELPSKMSDINKADGKVDQEEKEKDHKNSKEKEDDDYDSIDIDSKVLELF